MVEVRFTEGGGFDADYDLDGDEAASLLKQVAKDVGKSLLRSMVESGSISLLDDEEPPQIEFYTAQGAWSAPLEKILDDYIAHQADETPFDEIASQSARTISNILEAANRKIQELLKAEKGITFDEATRRANEA